MAKENLSPSTPLEDTQFVQQPLIYKGKPLVEIYDPLPEIPAHPDISAYLKGIVEYDASASPNIFTAYDSDVQRTVMRLDFLNGMKSETTFTRRREEEEQHMWDTFENNLPFDEQTWMDPRMQNGTLLERRQVVQEGIRREGVMQVGKVVDITSRVDTITTVAAD